MIAGRYQLVSHGTFYGDHYKSTSDYLEGEISYSEDGSLSIFILFKKEPSELNELLSYVGTFEKTSETKLVHHIHLCNQTKRNKTSEERSFTKIEDHLILGCPLDDHSRFEAVWKFIPKSS